MADETQVIARDNLNLRHAGSEDAAIIATIMKGAALHVDGPTNTAGYVPVHIYGHKAGQELWNDLLAEIDAGLDAKLYQGAIFDPSGPADTFGRTPGLVRGFVAAHWVLASQPRLGPAMTDSAPVTINAILASLERRGFYVPHDGRPGFDANFQALLTQILAVQEELGELASGVRRDRQDVAPLDWAQARAEAADVVIAAVCLLGAVAGARAGEVIAAKLAQDEARGWRHTGHRAPMAWASFEGDSGSMTEHIAAGIAPNDDDHQGLF